MEEFISFVDAYTRNKIKNGPIPNKRFTEKIFFFREEKGARAKHLTALFKG